LLTWVGATEICDATVFLGQVCTAFLLFYLLVAFPFLSSLESFLYLNGIRLFGSKGETDSESGLVFDSASNFGATNGARFMATLSVRKTKRGVKMTPVFGLSTNAADYEHDFSAFQTALHKESLDSIKKFNLNLEATGVTGTDATSLSKSFFRSVEAQTRAAIKKFNLSASPTKTSDELTKTPVNTPNTDIDSSESTS